MSANDDRIWHALFKIRAAVDGMMPDYQYLNVCKNEADAALLQCEVATQKHTQDCMDAWYGRGCACICKPFDIDCHTLHPASSWTEADGPVLWWAATGSFPVPVDVGWGDSEKTIPVSHWSRIPAVEVPKP